jgi:hypothetical protein
MNGSVCGLRVAIGTMVVGGRILMHAFSRNPEAER